MCADKIEHPGSSKSYKRNAKIILRIESKLALSRSLKANLIQTCSELQSMHGLPGADKWYEVVFPLNTIPLKIPDYHPLYLLLYGSVLSASLPFSAVNR